MTTSARQSTPRMTVSEFLVWAETQLDGRYELVDGYVVAMAPERIIHNSAKIAVLDALRAGIKQAGLPCRVYTDGIGVAIADRHWRIPDASVQCGGSVDPYATMLPDPIILVEVISPSSARGDTGTKLAEYFLLPGIRHYLIIDPEQRFAIHHSRDDAGDIQTRIVRNGAITFSPPGFSIASEDLFVDCLDST